jgi:hypothetical protein
VFPPSLVSEYAAGSPTMVMPSSENTAPVVCPAPLSLWQSKQWQWATTIGPPTISYLHAPQRHRPVSMRTRPEMSRSRPPSQRQ